MAQRGITNFNLPHYSHNTYDVLFYNDSILTTFTHDASIVSNWITGVEAIHCRRLTPLTVGLDCEWQPTYTRHQHYPVATLKLNVGCHCLIYQIIRSHYIPDELYNFLSNPNYTFVGVGVEQDVEKLQQDYELGLDMKYVDLRSLAVERYGNRELKQAGLIEEVVNGGSGERDDKTEEGNDESVGSSVVNKCSNGVCLSRCIC